MIMLIVLAGVVLAGVVEQQDLACELAPVLLEVFLVLDNLFFLVS